MGYAQIRSTIGLGNSEAVVLRFTSGDDIDDWKLQYEVAQAASEQALRYDGPYKEDYAGKGDNLCALQRYEEAIAAFDQAIQLDPSYTHAYSRKVSAISLKKQSKQAR